jgi:hypothetical protein
MVGAKTLHAVGVAPFDRKTRHWKFNPSSGLWLIFAFYAKKRDDRFAPCLIGASVIQYIHP